jgi:hypothetical protein
MNHFSSKVFGAAVFAGLMAITGTTAWAQDGGRGEAGRRGCPEPVSRNITVSSGPLSSVTGETTPDLTAYKGSRATTFGQTGVDTIFMHTVRWEVPRGACCQLDGRITVVVKAQSSADNDAVGLLGPGGTILAHQPLISTAAGQVHTKTFNLDPSVISSGHVTVYVQDDHSLQSIGLALSGCCLKPNVRTH